MTNPAGFDFTKFVPGFDFLKNLTPGAGGSAATSAAPGWVAPTLDPDELDKRIQELKTVQFWLEQNGKAVGATIQALEVQRMTLNTLRGMNMSFHDLAESLKVKPQAAAADKPKYTFTPAEAEPAAKPEVREPEVAPEPQPEPQAKARKTTRSKKAESGIDPAQWWGAVTEQFQHIATHALNDMSQRANLHAKSAAAKPATAAPTKAKAGAAKTSKRATTTRTSSAKKTSPRATPSKAKR